MFASAPDRGSVRTDIDYADPVAMKLLAGNGTPDGSLGAFPQRNDGLGFAFIPFVIKAIPIVVDLIGRVKGHGSSISDPVAAVWQAIPASAVNAHVGSGDYWYDNDNNAKLSSEEAAYRQQQVVAGTIGASVGDDGWWVDNNDGHQLSHSEAWDRYEALHAGHLPTQGPGGTTWSPGSGGTTHAPTIAGLPISTPMLLAGAAVIAALMFMPKRRSS